MWIIEQIKILNYRPAKYLIFMAILLRIVLKLNFQLTTSASP
jgi:hypothetical protein